MLGDLAFEGERYLEATKHLESLVGRASVLPKEDAVRALVRYVEAYGHGVAMPAAPATLSTKDGQRESIPPSPVTATHPRLAAAVDALRADRPRRRGRPGPRGDA